MALTTEQIGAAKAVVFRECGADLRPEVAEVFASAIAAEVRKQDDALIRQLVEALEYHRAQTRPIERTDEAITAGRARLGRPHD